MLTLSLLCCPRCRSDLASGEASVVCQGCGSRYPVVEGIPLLIKDPPEVDLRHQADLPVRPVYAEWKERLILKALPADKVCLDFGAGRQLFDDPCVIKLDIVPDPLLDVVGDLHDLPIKSDSIDFAFGGAVMEHVRDPARAIAELYRVIRPGGYIYADWAFLAAYHGFPHHYSNLTLQGVEDAFHAFTRLESGVAPHLAPGFALRSVLGTYREYFKPQSRLDREFVYLIDQILWHPLDEHDLRIDRADWFRIAAGHYFLGVKQPNGGESILPLPVLDAHRRSPDLQRRFPNPLNIGEPDNLMEWARSEGRATDPAIRACLDEVRPFDKDASGRPYPSRVVRDWPSRLMAMPDRWPPWHAAASEALWFSRSFRVRLRESWDARGAAGVVSCVRRSVDAAWRRGMRGLRKVGLLPNSP
jgi:SAM-dependent methyltransferase/uncharacterized protein YbaR (Trm112 family)